jgi:hypothetical protein
VEYLYKKPYSLSIGLTFLIIGTYVVKLDDLMQLLGMLAIVSSLFIFIAVSKDSLKTFNIARALLYLGYLMMYIVVATYIPLVIHLMFLLAFIMFHITLGYVAHNEYS